MIEKGFPGLLLHCMIVFNKKLLHLQKFHVFIPTKKRYSKISKLNLKSQNILLPAAIVA